MIKKINWGFVIRKPFNEEELKNFFGSGFSVENKQKGISDESVREIAVSGNVWYRTESSEDTRLKDNEIASYVSNFMKRNLQGFGEKVIYSNILMSAFLHNDDFAVSNKICEITIEKAVRIVELPKGEVDNGLIRYEFNVTGFDVVEFDKREISNQFNATSNQTDIIERARG